MVKREASTNALADSDTPSAKRRKDDPLAGAETADDAAEDHNGGENSDQERDASGEAAEEGPVMSQEDIRDEGLKVLQVLKEAKNKE